MIKRLFLFITILCCEFSGMAQTWYTPISPVNIYSGSGGNIGEYTRMCIVNGNPARVCYDVTHANLVYMRALDATGSSWGSPLTLDSLGDVGQYASIAVVNGNPAVAYYDKTKGDLKYVRALDASGNIWGNPVSVATTGAVGQYANLVVVNGKPAVAYYDVTTTDLKYVRATDASGAAWGSPLTVDATGDVGHNTSMCVVNGNPAIAYWDKSIEGLKYVRALDASGTSWGSPVILEVKANGSVGYGPSLAVVNGKPAVAFFNPFYLNQSGGLKYIQAIDASGTTWGSPVTLDATGYYIGYISLAVVNGKPAVAYHDVSNQYMELIYVRATDVSGTTWGGPVAIGRGGHYTSMCVVNGNPAISYYDRANRSLKFIRATDVSGINWGSPFSQEVGEFPPAAGQSISTTVVDGYPACSYYDKTNGSLKYVRATNTTGTAWGTPVTLKSSVNPPYISLAVVNGTPAVVYYDYFLGDLMYVRATNASGTTWSSPVTLDATGDVGLYASLATVNGNPAVSYYDKTNGNLKYVRASNASGTAWGIPGTLDATGDVGQYTSLATVNGMPAVSYYDKTNGNLKYVRSLNSSGMIWDSPVTLIAKGDVGQYTSMAVVNGNPAVAYYDFGMGHLNYIRSTNTSGTTWGSPVTLDAKSMGDVGRYASLAVVNGNPAVSYYDYFLADLKYVRANDASGTNWDFPVQIEVTGEAGQYSSMTVNGSNVYVGFYDATNKLPKVTRGIAANKIAPEETTDTISGSDNHFQTLKALSLEVIPNPVNEVMNLQYAGVQAGATVDVRVYDMVSGSVRIQHSVKASAEAGSITLRMGDHPSGTYIVELRNGGNVIKKKIIHL